jgi:glycosyltransferase involved in cell wall biosynthesis
MACEVPVIASRVGGLPEVIEHGVSGFLHPLEAIDEMAASAVELLSNPVLHKSVAEAAWRRVRSEFCVERVVPMYEACYRGLLS